MVFVSVFFLKHRPTQLIDGLFWVIANQFESKKRAESLRSTAVRCWATLFKIRAISTGHGAVFCTRCCDVVHFAKIPEFTYSADRL
jgi:hypothetical protein